LLSRHGGASYEKFARRITRARRAFIDLAQGVGNDAANCGREAERMAAPHSVEVMKEITGLGAETRTQALGRQSDALSQFRLEALSTPVPFSSSFERFQPLATHSPAVPPLPPRSAISQPRNIRSPFNSPRRASPRRRCAAA